MLQTQNRVHPSNQNLLGSQLLRNENQKLINIPSNNNQLNHSIVKQEVQIETNTNRNAGNTNLQLSPTSNKSYLKINGYNTIESLKKNFLTTIDSVTSTRLVEVLGGLAKIEDKKVSLQKFSSIWITLLDILATIQDNILMMNFENDTILPNSDQFISDLIISNVREIENQYLDLITNSSLRFLETVCTVHDLQYKDIINLRYDIRQWKKSNIDHIKSFINKKANSFSLSQNKDNNQSGGSKSIFSYICGCCLNSRRQVQPQNNGQSPIQVKR